MKNGYLPTRIDTLIGAGTHVQGDIACTGVLRVQGEVLGNVLCHRRSGGALIVDSAGNVAGAVEAPHMIVRGRVSGPAHACRSIEIHAGASLVGDVSFKEIAIHSGGILEGLLAPTVATADSETGQPDGLDAAAGAKPSGAFTAAATAGNFVDRLGGMRKVGIAIALAILVAGAWIGSRPTAVPSSADEAAQASTAVSPDAPASTPVLSGNADATTAEAIRASVKTSAQQPPQEKQEEIVAVNGANPGRAADVFLLIAHEPAVLYRKPRGEPGEGTRIAMSGGEKISVSISPDELFRVVKGQAIDIFFQGQKVPRRVLGSGAWISFVPVATQR